MATVHQTTPRAALTHVTTIQVTLVTTEATRLPTLHVKIFQTLTSCLGMQCTVIHVGTMTNYGQQWGTYTKVACGLRRSPCYKPSIITTPRNLPTVQLTYVQHKWTTKIVVSTLVSLPQQTQATTFTCPPWVATSLVS